MVWVIQTRKRVTKDVGKLPKKVQGIVDLLLKDLEERGPIQREWPSFQKTRGVEGIFHCHLNKNRPVYVASWKIIDDKTLEVIYVGSHEGADYARIR